MYPKCRGKINPETNPMDLYTLLANERNDARRLAGALNNMLDSMNLKEDIYYMGSYSTILAGILENSPVCLARRKVNNCFLFNVYYGLYSVYIEQIDEIGYLFIRRLQVLNVCIIWKYLIWNLGVCYVYHLQNCLHPASLIIVDRTLDVCGVTSHSTESVLDKILALLPRFPVHSTEVAVDMSPLCEAKRYP